MSVRRCTFKCGDWNCGSYQFNLYKADIDQGDLCDVHYWQTKAQREWVGLTDEEIGRKTILAGFNPEWKVEIGMVFSIVKNLEAKLKEKNT